MSTDTFEDDLRSLLHHSADAEQRAFVDVDPQAVLDRGRRVVRRRRVAAGLGATAAVLALGLAGFSALGSGVDRTEPVPGSSPTILTTGTAIAELSRGADVSPGGPGPTADGARVRVTVERSSGRVSYLADRDGTMEEVAHGTLPSSPRAADWWPTTVQGLTVGVLPATATDLVLLWAGDTPVSTHTMSPLPGTAFQAFAVWHGGTATQFTFAGLDWTDGTSVFRTDGSTVNSARLGGVVAFVDPVQNVVGVFGDGSIATKSLDAVRFGEVPVLMTGRKDDGSDTMRTALLLVLPAGARDVVVTAAPGATVESTDVKNGGTTDETLVVARMSVPPGVKGTGAATVTWTGADGRTRSNPVTG